MWPVQYGMAPSLAILFRFFEHTPPSVRVSTGMVSLAGAEGPSKRVASVCLRDT